MSWQRSMTILACVVLLSACSAGASEIKKDERIDFFPTMAWLVSGSEFWDCEIHGVVYELESRRLPLTILRRTLALNGDRLSAEETAIFNERARDFMVDHERRKDVSVRIGGTVYPVGRSGANGHFNGTIKLAASEIARLRQGNAVPFRAVLPDGDQRRFAGSILLMEEQGLSVISDIDDTIKISQVRDRKQLVANTFYRPFRPVAGMAELYQRWSQSGATVHYVSASPWQLYVPLSEFARTNGFPSGTFHMKQLRVQDGSFLKLFESPEKYKIEVIVPILKAFPKRRFVLVGDSGEKDPEVYGTLARCYPESISRIYIRNVTAEEADSDRYRQAFKGLPPTIWQIFKEPTEIR